MGIWSSKVEKIELLNRENASAVQVTVWRTDMIWNNDRKIRMGSGLEMKENRQKRC